MTREEIRIQTIAQLERISGMLGSMGEEKDWTEYAIRALEQEPCEDTVSRDDVVRIVQHNNPVKALEKIRALPSVTPQPRKGHWISTETKGVRYAFWCRYKCSLCGKLSDHTNFCPNCGADMKMDEVEE